MNKINFGDIIVIDKPNSPSHNKEGRLIGYNDTSYEVEYELPIFREKFTEDELKCIVKSDNKKGIILHKLQKHIEQLKHQIRLIEGIQKLIKEL